MKDQLTHTEAVLVLAECQDIIEERDEEIERLRTALREIRDCETLEAAKDIALKARTVPNVK